MQNSKAYIFFCILRILLLGVFMKATGVVRRIDELGRIVIPKEIRRTLKIKEGTPLEIYSGDSGELLLKKYSPIVELGEIAQDVCESIALILQKNVIITNMDKVISTSAGCKKMIDRQIDAYIEKLANARKTEIFLQSEKPLSIFLDYTSAKIYILAPIISGGDVVGTIIIFDDKNELGDCEKKIACMFAEYLSRQIY
jgi:AbrB family transcriptional regulator (stage V sporulation protein T)